MKELSIEEKAKAYDEALKYAMIYYKDGNEDMKMMMKTCFPVLTEESEDERIKKQIIYAIKELHVCDETKRKCVAWLEKQGEQDMIPLDKVIKFLDDQLVNDKDEVTGESFINFQNYGAFKETFISYFKRKMLEKQSEQNPAWSEEDEQYKSGLIGLVENSKAGLPINLRGKAADKCIYWLKSLKDRYTWKPSDKQMDALDFAANCIVPAEFCFKRKTLKELLEQLKKLREE